MIPDSVLLALGFAAIGSVAVIAGVAYSLRRDLSPTTRSAIQHLAAGTVFAGLTVDVLVTLVEYASKEALTVVFTLIGFVIGIGLMVGVVRGIGERKGGTTVLVTTIAVDLVADGGLIGLSTGLGSPTAAVLAAALAPEVFFLGATLNESLQSGNGQPDRAERRKLLLIATLIAAGILGAGAIGWTISLAGRSLEAAFFGFGAIALGYLVLEELLNEAHEQRRSPVMAGLLFLAFAIVFLVGLAVQ